MNVETLLPILASTLRDIFVILGVILIFQMIVLAYLKRHHLHGGKVIYTRGRLNQLGTVYFAVLLVFFQIELLTGKPTWIIVNERLMLFFYVMAYLGARSLVVTAGAGGLTQLVLIGFNATIWQDLSVISIEAVVAYAFVVLGRRMQLSFMQASFALTVCVGLCWQVVVFLNAALLANGTGAMSLVYAGDFLITNAVLSYVLDFFDRNNDDTTRIQYAASTDRLTQVENYASFERQLAKAFKDFRFQQTPVAMIAFDIDHFKQMNDTYGHLAGNEILAQVGRLLLDETRKTPDVQCFRVGGEEFNLMLRHQSFERAVAFANSLQARIHHYPFMVAGNVLHITVSMGLAQLKAADLNPDAFYDRTDQMLYYSKFQGRAKLTTEQDEALVNLAAEDSYSH